MTFTEAIFNEETLARRKIDAAPNAESKTFYEGVLHALLLVQGYIENFITG